MHNPVTNRNMAVRRSMSWINPATGVNSGLSIPHSRPLISKTQIKQGDNTDPSTRPSNHRRDHGNDDQRDPEAQARNRHKEPVQNHQPASHHHGPGLFPALGKPMLRRGWERCGGQIHEACLAGSIPALSSGKHPSRVARTIAECSQSLALYDNKTAVLQRERGYPSIRTGSVFPSSFRSPQRSAQGKAKTFYRTNFTAPPRGSGQKGRIPFRRPSRPVSVRKISWRNGILRNSYSKCQKPSCGSTVMTET